MENNNNQEGSVFGLLIEGEARQLLQTAAYWARIVAIAGFVSAGVALLSTIMVSSGGGGMALVGNLFAVIIAQVIFVVLNLFLYRFATNTLESFSNRSQVQFNEGTGNLKTYFKLMAILIIIFLVLVFIVFLAFAMGAAMR